MAWPPSTEDRRRAYHEDGRWLLNRYACPCGCAWTDEWACACDDDCPECGAACSPAESREIAFTG